MKNFQKFLQGWDCVTQTLYVFISSWYRKVKIPSQKLKKSFPTEKLPSQKLSWGSFRSSVLDWFDLAATEPDHRHASLKQISFLFIWKINVYGHFFYERQLLHFHSIKSDAMMMQNITKIPQWAWLLMWMALVLWMSVMGVLMAFKGVEKNDETW